MLRSVQKQALSSAEQRGIPKWIEAEKWLPGTMSVLATDLECIWIATYDGDVWRDAEDEPIDSCVTHWMDLPDLPDNF